MKVTGTLLFAANVRPKVTYRVLELPQGDKLDLVFFDRAPAAQALAQSLNAGSTVTVEGVLDTQASIAGYPKLLVDRMEEGAELSSAQSSVLADETPDVPEGLSLEDYKARGFTLRTSRKLPSGVIEDEYANDGQWLYHSTKPDGTSVTELEGAVPRWF